MSSQKKEPDPNEKLAELFKIYMEKLYTFPENQTPELEIKFGTKSSSSGYNTSGTNATTNRNTNMTINKTNFDRVIKSLLNFGFKQGDTEQYLLRTILDTDDKKDGVEYKNVRLEINGLKNIQDYCISNSVPQGAALDKNYRFVEKTLFNQGGTTYYPVDFPDHNFRATYNIEHELSSTSEPVNKLLINWKTTKKVFRYLKRYRLTHPDYPFAIDMSIVKATSRRYGKMQTTYTMRECDLFNRPENYEIEIEVVNNQIGAANRDTATIISSLKRIIKYILIGLQDSYFPIGLKEQGIVRDEYYELIEKRDYRTKPVVPADFIGPSSVTLQIENIVERSVSNGEGGERTPGLASGGYAMDVVNIRENYTVTDKADGARKMLFVNGVGRIYFISNSMNIEYTGCLTKNEGLFYTILDGEHVTHDKDGRFINLFMAFDIYYINKKNVTGYPLIKTDKDDIEDDNEDDKGDKDKSDDEKKASKEKKMLYRLTLLNTVIQTIAIKAYSDSKEPFIRLDMKRFYSGNIFSGSNTILTNIAKGLYRYNTDGLIFTPANTGVASDKIGYEAPNYRTTWNASLKWKPPVFNTVDFLVSIKTDKTGQYFVGNRFTQGTNLTQAEQITKYHSLVLRVGFDEKRHGYINPCQNIIEDRLPKRETVVGKAEYKPMQFYPTNPSDDTAGATNVQLRLNQLGELKMFTLENEEIEDNSIVEFKYDITMEEGWRWQPLRVRYDKTNELRSGLNNFGNAYHTANNVWHSIHYPVTETMITTGRLGDNSQGQGSGQGQIIGAGALDNDVYYNKNNKVSQTRALRDFHNLYIKQMLIDRLTVKRESILIDYAVGKGGDLPKWINAGIRFALGVDLSRDNIENRLDGACARYLNYCKKYAEMPRAVFLHGDSSINIRSGEAFQGDKSRQIVNALFGTGTKDMTILGKGIHKNYGVAVEGFNISSIQFAIHYMFENRTRLHSFMKNLTECTKINGYLVGTCYDGNSVFNLLAKKDKGESIDLYRNGDKIWEITRQYVGDEFPDNESSLGYAIDVYQETINKVFREYLVNYKYLKRVLENYGFVELSGDELTEIGLKESSAMFSEMFNAMRMEIATQKRKMFGNADKMSDEEKTISFLNRYFIFKKVRNVDADKIRDQYSDPLTDDEKRMAEEILESLDK